MSVKPFVDVLNAFEPLLQNEILAYTTMLDSTYAMKTQDAEIRYQEDTCPRGRSLANTDSNGYIGKSSDARYRKGEPIQNTSTG